MKNQRLLILVIVMCLFACIFIACDTHGSTPDHVCEFGEWTVTKQPTCTEVGERERYCSCGEKQTSSLAATGHSYTHVVTDPTCTEQGFTTHTCACGDSYVDIYVDALGHDEIEHAAQEPTCTEIGWDAYVTCSRCNYSTYNEIPASHSIVNHDAQAPTCTEIGWDVYVTCSRCNYSTYIEIPATGHSHSAVVTDPTCTEQGYTTHTCACGDSYVDTYVDALGHTWGDWYETKSPTDTKAGEERRECNKCDHYETNVLPALGQKDLINGTWCNLTWALKTTGNLVISGLGEMNDFNSYSTDAWRNYSSLIKTVTIEDGVTTIGDYAFYGCTSLTNIVIPDGVTTIGDRAFPNCTSSTRVIIGDSVTSIGDWAFVGCTSLTGIEVDKDNPSYKSINGNLYSKDGKKLIQYAIGKTDKSFTIPDDVTTIGTSAFYGCSSLTSIVMPNSVTCIDLYAFECCTSLTNIVIPDGVTCIANGAFYDCDSLTSVTIGSGVTTIGDYAFLNCTSLTSVVIPDSVTTIGNYVFRDCSSLTSIVIPDSVTAIGDCAFQGCTSLISIVIPDSVTTIGYDAFYNCSKLVEVYNKSSLNITKGSTDNGYVGYYALNVYTEDYVSKVSTNEDGYIIYTDGADKILVGYVGAETNLVIPDGITAINKYAFYGCTSLTNIVIPDGVTTIGSYAFEYHTSLTSITIPDSVTTIGYDAFRLCSSLTSVYYLGTEEQWNNMENHGISGSSVAIYYNYEGMPSGMWGDVTWTLNESTGELVISDEGEMDTFEYYSTDAWRNYSSLIKTVIIENGVTTIGSYAFSDCTSLTSIVIPDSVTAIGSRAFYDCKDLTDVYYLGTLEQWCGITFSGESANPIYPSGLLSKTVVNLYIDGEVLRGELVVPNTVTEIKKYTFANYRSITSVVISDSVTTIGDGAFAYCTSLTSVTIGDGVASIGKSAFSLCISLSSVTIGDSVTTIGDRAFSDCYELVEVYNKSSLNIVAGSLDYGYVGYYALNIYTEEGGSKLSTNQDGYIIYTDGADKILVGCVGAETNLVIPDGMTAINKYAFYGCYSLTSIVIPDSVTTIGEGAFYGCTSLTSITFGENSQLTSIGDEAFVGCKSLTSITIPDSVTTIGVWSFYYCDSLTSVIIGDSVTTIGDKAFYNCTSLTGIEVDKDNPSYKSINGNLYSKDGKKLIQYAIGKTDKSFTIPDDVTTIGTSAFYGCSSLTSITIPDSVTTIGDSAFDGCTSLTSIVIPDGVTAIGDRAFEYCTSLTSVTFGENSQLITIGNYAFVGCRRLTGIIIPDSVTTIGSEAFYWCDRLTCVVFENPTGWYVTQTEGATSGINLTLTNASTNAIYLKDIYNYYCYYYWYKN